MRYSEGLREPRIHEYPTMVHAEDAEVDAEDAEEGGDLWFSRTSGGSRGDAAIYAAVAAVPVAATA